MTKLTHTAHLAGLLLCLVALSTASVTWRRVVKTSSAPVQYLTTEQVPSTTKSAITWRRSTVSRRSTTRQEPPPLPSEEEEDEIEVADSREEALHVAEDNEPRIKPLVPGSRPGFWIDSTRRKKQSSLLKSGSRRNSLFPTKPSTIAPRSTKPPSRFTPLTTTPTTTTEAPKTKLLTTKSRFFGRNRLTKSPVSLRRTTRVPQTEPDIKESPETTVPEITATSVDDSRRETDEFPSSTTVEDDGSTEPVRKVQPGRLKTGLGLRRRPKNNGTRLSWKKNSGRFTTPLKFSSTRTTSVPSTSTQETEKASRRPTAISRLRNRTRANRTTTVPKVSWTRNQTPSTASPTKATENKRVEKVKGPTDYLRKRKVNKFKRVKITSTTPAYDDQEEEEEDDEENEVFTTTTAPTEDYEIFTTVKPYEFKIRTTVEPFYLTRDYGQLITAVHDEKIVRNQTRSRTRAKATESPELSTTETEIFSTTEEFTPTEEYQYIESTTPNVEDVIDTNEDVVENLVSFNSYRATTEIPTITTTEPTTIASEETTEFAEYEEPTTPLPPPQLSSSTSSSSTSTTPFKSSYNPADPGKNAYVVWSMGQNGSGWSYEKQGEQVKWSAINSNAAGDRWSVQGKDEIGESLWVPTRNKSGFLGGSGQKPEGEDKVHFNYKPTSDKEAQRNYTQSDSIDGIALQQSPPGIRDFTPPSYQKTSNDYRTDVNNEPSLIQTFSLGNSDNGTNYNLYTPLSGLNNSPANFDTFQYGNSSNAQEYITVAPEFLEGLYQTTLTPESYAQYYPGYQEYTVQTPDLSLYPSKNAQRGVSDLSGIPPALVKAVVDAKRWTVVGNGGEEGWSLLGENGQLEWRIHNIDGKWSVTSADEVMKMPIQVPVHTISSGKEGAEINQDDGVKEVKVTAPKVWRLEDDYEKWKALSAEGATEVDTPNYKRIPNGEYDYDQSEELQDDYYEGEDDYDNPAGHNAYYANDKYEERPLWGENQMEVNQNSEKYSKYGGNIESVNTKEDAIAAWKSLLAGKISWAPSTKENPLPKRTRPTRRYEHNHSVKSSEALDRNVATHSRRQDYKKNDHTGEYLKNREANLHHPSQGKLQTFGNPDNRDLDRLEENHKTRNNNWHQAYSAPSQQENEKQNQYQSFVNPSTALELEQRQKEFQLNGAVQSVDPKDHAKVNALVNKLESIQKGGKGRTVIDLSHLVNLIKAKSNSSLTTKNDQSEKGKTQKDQNPFIKNRNEYDHSEISKETSPSIQKYHPQDPQNKYSFSKHEIFSNLNDQIKHSNQNKLAYPEAYQGYSNQPNYPVALNDPQPEKLDDTAVNRRQQEKYSHFIEEKYSDLNGYNIRPHKKHHSTNKNVESHGYVEDREVYFRGTKATENPDGHSLNTRFNYENLQKENVPQHIRPDVGNIQYNNERKHTDRYNFDDGSPYNLYNPADYSGDDFRKSDKEVQGNTGYNGNNRLHEEYQVVSKPSHHQKTQEVNQRDPSEGNFNEEITPNETYGVGHRPRKTKSKLKRKQKGHYNSQISRDNDSSSLVERIDQQSKEQREPDLAARHPVRGKIRNTRRRKTSGKRPRKSQDRHRDEEINNLQQYRPSNQGRTVPSNVDSSEELLLDRYQAPDSIEHKRRFDENIYASQLKPLPMKYRRNEKKKSHKPHQSPPIILSSETEFEDDEDGTKKSRKIIVIDYAGKQKKKSPIDRKDLELIIRNVKNRRAEISEDVLDEKRETNSTAI